MKFVFFSVLASDSLTVDLSFKLAYKFLFFIIYFAIMYKTNEIVWIIWHFIIIYFEQY